MTDSLVLSSKKELEAASKNFRRVCRGFTKIQQDKRDKFIYNILSTNPKSLYKAIKNFKSAGTPTLTWLDSDGVLYDQDMIPDGFYAALGNLKSPPNLPSDESSDFLLDTILEIASSGPPIPSL